MPTPPTRVPGARVRLRACEFALVALALTFVASHPAAAARNAFGIEDVAKRAKKLAAQSYRDHEQNQPNWLREITYDQWRDIRFRPERALFLDKNLPFTIQFFHPGFHFDRSIKVNVVTATGVASVPFAPDMFDYGKNEFGSRVPQDLGFAGMRIHYPIKNPNYRDEVIVFLGASYFRAVGRDQAYGLSSRGLAIDTASPSGEEFPWFREFWLVRPAPGAQELTIYALLDSPSATGAYKFVVAPGPETRVDVDMRIFPRAQIKKLGVGALTSMFLHGENGDGPVVDDYRPEVHDSDGLLIAARNGEWLWRPLENPSSLIVSSFATVGPRGFGLLQRDRNLDHYQDFEARQDLRPSVWIEPKGEWGAGRVELVEIPSNKETNDNIVSYWVPDAPVTPSTPVSLVYSMYWYGEDHTRPPGGWTNATRRDKGPGDGARRLLVDFEGKNLGKIPPESVVEGVVTAATRGGNGGQRAPAELLEQQVIHNPIINGWRLVFQVKPPDDEPVELRAFLRHGGDVITETWSYQLHP
jgi:periplasmic glucans biosynthesis protein